MIVVIRTFLVQIQISLRSALLCGGAGRAHRCNEVYGLLCVDIGRRELV